MTQIKSAPAKGLRRLDTTKPGTNGFPRSADAAGGDGGDGGGDMSGRLLSPRSAPPGAVGAGGGGGERIRPQQTFTSEIKPGGIGPLSPNPASKHPPTLRAHSIVPDLPTTSEVAALPPPASITAVDITPVVAASIEPTHITPSTDTTSEVLPSPPLPGSAS